MRIELVLTPSGLVGRRFQDRWNLAQLGITSIPWTRNQAGIKRLRRMFPEFVFTTVKVSPYLKNFGMLPITDEERAMFPARTIKRNAA